jgi:hypothetical protein
MSQRTTRSIEFVVDEAAAALIGYERTEALGGQQLALEEVLRLPLADLRVCDSAELHRSLGRLVLGVLDTRDNDSIAPSLHYDGGVLLDLPQAIRYAGLC